MKKLLLSLMVLATLASCGKDNKVASTAASTTSTSPIQVTTADQNGISLGQKIDNHTTQFGVGVVQLNYYTRATYNQIIADSGSMRFHYTKSTQSVSGNGQNCEKKWGIFYICSSSYSSSTSTSVTESRSPFYSELVNNPGVDAKIAELKDIINNASTLYPIETDGYSYRIRTKNGKQYIINTLAPLLANPTGVMDTSGAVEYLYKITY